MLTEYGHDTKVFNRNGIIIIQGWRQRISETGFEKIIIDVGQQLFLALARFKRVTRLDQLCFGEGHYLENTNRGDRHQRHSHQDFHK